MGVSAPLLSAAGVIAAVVAMMVDGRRAVAIAVVLLAAGLAPTAATFGGAPGRGGARRRPRSPRCSWRGAAGWAGRVLPWLSGLDPTIPAFAPTDRLFGPRSGRAFGAAVAFPVASWVSFNVPIGQVTVVEGLLFPIAYAWTCGVIRLLLARTVEDLGVGSRDGRHRDRYRVAAAQRQRLASRRGSRVCRRAACGVPRRVAQRAKLARTCPRRSEA